MQRISQVSHTACRPLWCRAPRQCLSIRCKPTPPTSRQFSDSTHVKYPRKDSQDKDSINTEATEYSKSGTDDASARHDDTAFDPDVTGPSEQKNKVGDKTGVSYPLTLIHCTDRLDISGIRQPSGGQSCEP